MIRTVRSHILQTVLKLLSQSSKGRRPFLQVIIDLTTLEKRGKFKDFDGLISVYNGKRGLHLVVVYLVVAKWRIPWSFRVWRGKGTPSPAQLGLKLVKRLPKSFTKNFQVIILADTAFGSVSRPKSFAIAHKAIPIKPTVVQKTVFLDTFSRKLFDKI
jgi:hypothetical protein